MTIMDELMKRLKELLDSLETQKDEEDILIVTKDKLSLYLSKFLNDRTEYNERLNAIDSYADEQYAYQDAILRIKSLIKVIIEDLELSKINIDDDSNLKSDLTKTRKEVEKERKQIQVEAESIKKIKEEILIDRDKLYSEQEKFDEFKKKLELSNKNIDFQSIARKHKRTSYFWGILAGLLIILLIGFLLKNISLNDSFISIAKDVNCQLKDGELVNATLYFSFSKFIFTRLLLYSMLIYAIVFCIKNYNSQMHNSIINSHKSNALKSILSLLDTAKSDDGNDKLLIQATQAIFSHQQTGYYGKESEPSNPNLVTNVIDSAAKKV